MVDGAVAPRCGAPSGARSGCRPIACTRAAPDVVSPHSRNSRASLNRSECRLRV